MPTHMHDVLFVPSVVRAGVNAEVTDCVKRME